MIVQCDECRRYYDDAKCWTICPHGPLWAGLKDYCPIYDTVRTAHGPCRHQQGEPIQMESNITLKDAVAKVREALPPGGSASATFAVKFVGEDLVIDVESPGNVSSGNHVSVHISNSDPPRTARSASEVSA